jgi:hypothetical protein
MNDDDATNGDLESGAPNRPESDNATDNATDNASGNSPSCGSRTVASIPPAGDYDFISDFRQEVEGNSGLATYFEATSIPDCLESPTSSVTMQIGENGAIVDAVGGGDRYIVKGGCLSIDGFKKPEFDLEDIESLEFETPCPGNDMVAIGFQQPMLPPGFGGTESQTDPICATVEVIEECFSCSQSNGEWVTEATITTRYTAVSSGEVMQPDACTGEIVTIEVREGDSADVTIATTTTLSPS